MQNDHSTYGLVCACLGAVLLAVGVFLPWYGLHLTPAGAAAAQQAGSEVAAHYGNSALQGLMAGVQSKLSAAVGLELGHLSARDALEYISLILLALAGLALLDGLLALARHDSLPTGAGGALAPLGLVAVLLVAYRMVDPPSAAGGIISLSLREGAWLCLLGALAILGGGLLPRLRRSTGSPQDRADGAFAGLSGWTPEG